MSDEIVINTFVTYNENCDATYLKATATVFDYGAVSPDVAERLRTQASLIRGRSMAITEAVIQTGRDLRAVQQQLKRDGVFRAWVTADCGFSAATSYNYINASKFVEENPTVRHLHPRTLYKLAAKSTPSEIVQEVLRRASGGAAVPYQYHVRFQRLSAKRQLRRKTSPARLSKRKREELEAREAKEEKERAEHKLKVRTIAEEITSRFGSGCASYLLDVRGDLDDALDVLKANA